MKPVRSEHCGKRSVGASIARPGKAEAAADFPGGYGIRPYVQGSMLVIDPETLRHLLFPNFSPLTFSCVCPAFML